MARQIRKKSGTGIYHIMLRGINRQDIFEDDEDYYHMIHILKGMTERFDEHGVRLTPLCTFYAFCLMSNHIHLLIQEREEDISGIVKRVGVAYAYYFNKKYGRSGHLFQDRFRSEPVDSIEYFVTLLRYIHQNPVKAGIVENIADYQWSSWNEYISPNNADSFCAAKTVYTRIPKDELNELVHTTLEEYEEILDIDSESPKQPSDDDVKDFLLHSEGISNPLMNLLVELK